MITLLYIAVGLQLLDAVSTYRGIKTGKAVEGNPLMLKLINRFGLVTTVIFAKTFAIAMSISIYLNYPIALLAIIALYGYVVYNNFKIIK